MSTHYECKPHEIESITNRFGKDFYEKALQAVDIYADKWSLSSFQLIPSYSANLLLKCDSQSFGPAVLKIGHPSSGEIRTEFNTLREYDGRRFCKVLDADLDNGIILEARVEPGVPLREEGSLEKRLSVFCSLYDGLHLTPDQSNPYPTYTGWVSRITAYMGTRQDCKELYAYMKQAEALCQSVSSLYARQMLLHGDFHHDNILLDRNGEYIIIDPKGVLGDPVFDVPRFILNEFDDDLSADTFTHINGIISVLAKKLRLPSDIVRQCLFIETAMGMCWSAEDGATPAQYSQLVRTAAFAESLLHA